jgi:hypothetical protein
MGQKLSDGARTPQNVMTVEVETDQVCDGEATTDDAAVVVMGPDGALLTIHLDGSVSGDPAAVEQEGLSVVGTGSPLGRALLGLARLALRVSRPN